MEELTEKYEKVKEAFWNPKTGKYEPKTWAELIEQIPKGTLSPLLNVLIEEGFVKRKIRQTIYTLVKPFAVKTHGKTRKRQAKGVGPTEQIMVSKKGRIRRKEGLIFHRYGREVFRKKTTQEPTTVSLQNLFYQKEKRREG